MWHYVRVEDYRDDANFHDWAINKSHMYVSSIHEYIKGMYRGNASYPRANVRLTPSSDFRVIWVEYVSEYDENETVERLGFIYTDSINNRGIERVFLVEHGVIDA